MAGKFATPQWAFNSNIYEVNVRQYTAEGTLNAFAKHLPRLQQMGVDILWFMPLTPISLDKRQGSFGSYYACSNYMSIDQGYGTTGDFKMVVQQAHDLGMKVITDIVANHTGYDHVWTKSHPEYYKKNEAGAFYDMHGWVDVIDLDYTIPALRKAMVGVMQYWIDTYEVDGFRCDMAHLVPLDFWAEARTELDDTKPLFWLAETEDLAYHKVFDASYTWKFLHLMEDVYKGFRSVVDVENVLKEYKNDFSAEAMRLFFITNHDENSHSGSEYERLGNGVRAFAILCATAPNSIPLIYSGQEIPNKKKLLFFEKDEIDWNYQCLLQDFYATLLQLRKNNSAFGAGDCGGTMEFIYTSDLQQNIMAYLRSNEQDAVLVMLNLTPKSMIKFSLKGFLNKGKYRSIWSGLEIDIDEETHFELQAWDFLVYEKVR